MYFIDPKKWYVVYSKPQKEEFAEFCLRARDIEVFLPKLIFPELLKKRKRIVPLFPNYLFTRIRSAEEYYRILWTPGVSRIVSFNGKPAPLDEDVVLFIKAQGIPGGGIPARLDLSMGQEVHITRGPLEGLVGIIHEPPGAKGRVRILMGLLNRQVKVDVPLNFVSCSWLTRPYKSGCSKSGSYTDQANA